ncbi:hypothetical protein CYJ57_05525, partial [Falseniella ignava]
DEVTGAVTTDYPEGGEQPTIEVKDGETLPDGKTEGTHKVKVIVTYPDKTTKEVEVPVIVGKDTRSDAEKNDPEAATSPDATTLVTELNVLPKAEDGIGNKGQLTNVKQYVWSQTPDVSKVGDTTGKVLIQYNDGSTDEVEVPVKVVDSRKDNEKYPLVDPEKTEVVDKDKLTDEEKEKVKEEVKKANPKAKEVDVEDNGNATITYPDDSKNEMPSEKTVTEKPAATEYQVVFNANGGTPTTQTAKVREGEKVEGVTEPTREGYNFVKWVVLGTDKIFDPNTNFNKDMLAEGEDSLMVVAVWEKLEDKKIADEVDPTIPEKTGVKDLDNLTDDENKEVKDKIEEANKDKFPEGTKVEVDDKGNATITYPDGSKDTIPAEDLVFQYEHGEPEITDKPELPIADIIEPNTPDKTGVEDKDNLTDDEKKEVKDKIEEANKDNFPEGTEVEVDDKGDATITYPDESTDTIPAKDLVKEKESEDKTIADEVDPTIPEKTEVEDTNKLTEDEKKEVKDKIEEANKDKFPEGTEVEVGDKGDATITYPDESTDTIPAKDLVKEKESEDKTDADKITPNIPEEKTGVKDLDNLTDDEKKEVKDKIEEANKDKFPEGTEVEVDDKGDATITYPDKSTDTIPAKDLVKEKESEDKTDADKITPNIPEEKTGVKDLDNLTDDEKKEVKDKIEEANKDKFPEGTEVEIDDKGNATITYPDGSKDTIPAEDLVFQYKHGEPEIDDKPELPIADIIEPNTPDKTEVEDKDNLTEKEKEEVKDKIEEANKGKFPEGTEVEVGDNGDVTVTYPDGSKDVIPGDQTVTEKEKSDAEKNPAVTPDEKTGVKDLNNLTDKEKEEVKDKVEKVNPEAKDVTIDDKGNATITYPDGSTNTIPAEELVFQYEHGEPEITDKPELKIADIIDPIIPDKTEVGRPGLTQSERDEVERKIKEANKDNFPEGTKVEVDESGNATITYPDGSIDTIPWNKLVYHRDDEGAAESDKPSDEASDKDSKETEEASSTAKSSSGLLPETGESASTAIFGAAALSVLAGLGLVAKRREDEEEA